MRKKDKIDLALFLGSMALKIASEVLNRFENNREIKRNLINIIEDAKKKKK